jgi:uncharacterized protein (DUF302 family)
MTGTEIPFHGVRMRYDSAKSFDDVVAALLDDVGDEPVPIDDFATRFATWEAYEREVQSHVGSSGFMLFATLDHGGWIKKTGIERNLLRVVIGNPLIAITMLRHDVTAGLFVPVELLVAEEQPDRSSLTYVVPSSVMVVEENEPLRAAAVALDAKLAALAAKVTSA